MSPLEDIERLILESYSFISEYRDKLQVSTDPKEEKRIRREIKQQEDLIKEHLEDYLPRCRMLDRSIPSDIREIATRFPNIFAKYLSKSEFVNPEQESLIKNIRTVIQILTVFRRVNANTLQILIKDNILPRNINAVNLLGELHTARLLDKPSIREPFYRDNLLRPVLGLDIASQDETNYTQYHNLNKIALQLYDGWIQELQDPILGPTQRLLSVIEWLFHALQDKDTSDDEIRAGIQEYITILRGEDTSSDIVDLIAEEIKKDFEICYLARRLGEDGIAIICDWLQAAK